MTELRIGPSDPAPDSADGTRSAAAPHALVKLPRAAAPAHQTGAHKIVAPPSAKPQPVGTPAPARPAHRHDLDGLRGIAIALVVAFHVWAGRVSGGVDVFLVLSGFFFTGAVVRAAERSGGVALRATIARTGRRLMPSLVVVLVAIAVATVALRPYTQFGTTAEQTIATLFYTQNWYLATAELDYLSPDPSVSPLQHLWSMSVQGQFYLLILAVIGAWAAARRKGVIGRRGLVIALVAIGAASFWYAVFGTGQHQAWTYYDSAARGWELLVGAALAIAAPWLRVPKRLRGLLAVVGLLMVLTCGPLFDGANQFPGVAALWPVGAAALVIVSGVTATDTSVHRVLGSRVCTRLGELAYPLYLWHWPLLIFFLAQSGRTHAGLVDGLAVIAISLVLAALTHRYVEQPLRARRAGEAAPAHHRSTGVIVSALAGAVMAAAISWQLVVLTNPATPPGDLSTQHYPGAAALTPGAEFPDEPMRPSVFEAHVDTPAATSDGCITPNREVRVCTYGDPNATRSIALVGGSHSEHWLPALERLGVERGVRIVSYLKEGCPLTLSDEPSYAEYPFPECREWSEEVLDRLAAERPDWVFTLSTRYRSSGDGDEVPPEYLAAWTALEERGLHVLAMRDTPRLRRDGVFYRADDCLAQRGTPDSCGVDRKVVLDPVDPAHQPAAGYPNVWLLDLSDSICRPQQCRVTEGNVMIYRDEHHLTATYARTLAAELGRQIGAVTRWW
ncbi:acyltransferase family protein [Nocardia camponoti]|uniref:Acyltransferase n=1 Tax=Nocardia camponoti TaxID=1616106 RepID=A0A917VE85_9NOCA|nr:acyltransferase family protein [Nocardia camponoti]GGK68369.1 acyltransferase [Nocardia camponoti]